MKITSKAHYGLEAMCELARKENAMPLSVKAISNRQHCSNAYMEQIFSLLKKAGLITSSRGAHGGYKLSKSPEEISIGSIIRALEGEIGFTECSSDQIKPCEKKEECLSKGFWEEFYKNINLFLENKKLSELI